jgi:hypothetical protein
MDTESPFYPQALELCLITGFDLAAVQTLDKKHRTFKQVTAEGAVGYDVVVNCRKPTKRLRRRRGTADVAALLRKLVDSAPPGPCPERTARYLHARLTGELLRAGAPVELDYRDVLERLREDFRQKDGHWYARAE